MEEKNIIDLWMKYTYNYSTILLDDNYVPGILISVNNPKHLAKKWLEMSGGSHSSGTTALLYLWHELSESNKDLFTRWLVNNYKG